MLPKRKNEENSDGQKRSRIETETPKQIIDVDVDTDLTRNDNDQSISFAKQFVPSGRAAKYFNFWEEVYFEFLKHGTHVYIKVTNTHNTTEKANEIALIITRMLNKKQLKLMTNCHMPFSFLYTNEPISLVEMVALLKKCLTKNVSLLRIKRADNECIHWKDYLNETQLYVDPVSDDDNCPIQEYLKTLLNSVMVEPLNPHKSKVKRNKLNTMENEVFREMETSSQSTSHELEATIQSNFLDNSALNSFVNDEVLVNESISLAVNNTMSEIFEPSSDTIPFETFISNTDTEFYEPDIYDKEEVRFYPDDINQSVILNNDKSTYNINLEASQLLEQVTIPLTLSDSSALYSSVSDIFSPNEPITHEVNNTPSEIDESSINVNQNSHKKQKIDWGEVCFEFLKHNNSIYIKITNKDNSTIKAREIVKAIGSVICRRQRRLEDKDALKQTTLKYTPFSFIYIDGYASISLSQMVSLLKNRLTYNFDSLNIKLLNHLYTWKEFKENPDFHIEPPSDNDNGEMKSYLKELLKEEADPMAPSYHPTKKSSSQPSVNIWKDTKISFSDSPNKVEIESPNLKKVYNSISSCTRRTECKISLSIDTDQNGIKRLIVFFKGKPLTKQTILIELKRIIPTRHHDLLKSMENEVLHEMETSFQSTPHELGTTIQSNFPDNFVLNSFVNDEVSVNEPMSLAINNTMSEVFEPSSDTIPFETLTSNATNTEFYEIDIYENEEVRFYPVDINQSVNLENDKSTYNMDLETSQLSEQVTIPLTFSDSSALYSSVNDIFSPNEPVTLEVNNTSSKIDESSTNVNQNSQMKRTKQKINWEEVCFEFLKHNNSVYIKVTNKDNSTKKALKIVEAIKNVLCKKQRLKGKDVLKQTTLKYTPFSFIYVEGYDSISLSKMVALLKKRLTKNFDSLNIKLSNNLYTWNEFKQNTDFLEPPSDNNNGGMIWYLKKLLKQEADPKNSVNTWTDIKISFSDLPNIVEIESPNLTMVRKKISSRIERSAYKICLTTNTDLSGTKRLIVSFKEDHPLTKQTILTELKRIIPTKHYDLLKSMENEVNSEIDNLNPFEFTADEINTLQIINQTNTNTENQYDPTQLAELNANEPQESLLENITNDSPLSQWSLFSHRYDSTEKDLNQSFDSEFSILNFQN